MSRSARVRSIDVPQRLAVALRAFAEEATAALDDLGLDLHRAVQWIEYDQKDYWTQELRRAETAASEAKINLERRRMFRVGDQTPSCREEKMAVEAARRRVEIARQKLEAVKRWGRAVEQEAIECRGAVAPLAGWLQAEVPRAIAALRNMGGALAAYVDLEPRASDSSEAQRENSSDPNQQQTVKAEDESTTD